MNFAPIRLPLPWLLGRAGSSEEQNRKLAISHVNEVIDGLLWCEVTGVIETNIRDICLFLLLREMSSTDKSRRDAFVYLMRAAGLACRTKVPMAALKGSPDVEQGDFAALEEQVNSWLRNPYDTPRFVSTILHPEIVSLLVPDTQGTVEWADSIRGFTTGLLRLYYQKQITFDQLVLQIDDKLWKNRQEPPGYQTAKALRILLKDPTIPPIPSWDAHLDLKHPGVRPHGNVRDRLTVLYLHDIVLPLSRRVIALYAGPLMTQRTELWALVLRLADMLRDYRSYRGPRSNLAEAWGNELDAMVTTLRESPRDLEMLTQDIEHQEDGGNLREHIVWAFMTAVADQYLSVTVPSKEVVDIDSREYSGKRLK